MTSELSIFAARVREHIGFWSEEFSLGAALNEPAYRQHADIEFNGLAVMLFTLQYKYNAPYRRLCEARGVQPRNVNHWWQIPCVPTAAFKEWELTCLHPEDRTHVFYSSGTTEQRPSRHFHNADSLALYEASLWPWLGENLRLPIYDLRLLSLTPPVEQAPHSSLVHMFDFVRRKVGADAEEFVGRIGNGGAWTVDVDAALLVFNRSRRREEDSALGHNPPPDVGGYGKPLLILGTAFSFVHLLDALRERNVRLQLPAGSRVLETGGYKGRSRSLPKAELHQLITTQLGVAPENIICEYGMSELSSQAYEVVASGGCQVTGDQRVPSRHPSPVTRHFKFPPWARARVISPETGGEVEVGETGLLQVFDLANAFSVLAIQTEDLAVRRDDGFDLIGRSAAVEPRGCSLMLE
jgi:hypothetical protein